ncbi:NUDIX domain-containing protein [Desulfosporosinus sp. OT]|uniref:NUDIX hydrolase n=1 Tax=Desulfosporosinus sp. OT TaxID=913865 RepID=UPI000223B0B2|nr:NUDIX domain-containing protein [Desulfosporosinus sp. OT]EGW38858.1 NUDIX domain protein [Desulfosporosinus sp. OT]
MSHPTAPYLFCPLCGKPLQKSIIADQLRSRCSECSYVNWGNFSLGVGGVLWHNGKVLLVQRAHNPGKGMWTIPGGYVDQEESIWEAVIREIQEETGIIAKPLSIIGLRDRPVERHDTYIIFLMQFLGGSLQAQPEEVSDLGFFTLEECRALPIPSLTLSALEASHSVSQGLIINSDVKLSDTFSTLYQIR